MCDKCNYLKILDKIETILEENEFLKESTVDLLETIYEWIEQHCHVTKNRIKAICKIEKRKW